MPEMPTHEELATRITAHLGVAKCDAERRDIGVAWGGYIAGLLEWGLLTVGDHEGLSRLLPMIDDNPVLTIFLGVDD